MTEEFVDTLTDTHHAEEESDSDWEEWDLHDKWKVRRKLLERDARYHLLIMEEELVADEPDFWSPSVVPSLADERWYGDRTERDFQALSDSLEKEEPNPTWR